MEKVARTRSRTSPLAASASRPVHLSPPEASGKGQVAAVRPRLGTYANVWRSSERGIAIISWPTAWLGWSEGLLEAMEMAVLVY